MKDNTASGTFYFLGFIGAAIYYVQHAATFWEGLTGVVKALFWPAVVIYRLFMYLG